MSLSDKRNQNLMAIIKKMHERMEETDVEKARASQEHVAMLTIPPKNLTVEEFDLDGMKCEWIKPVKPHIKKTIILYCHGGGYMTGSAFYSRSITYKLAEAANKEIFCFNYRLAPEFKFPAPLEDAIKAWDYLMYLGYGARDIVVIGDSAGGNLALTLTMKLKEQGRRMPGGLVLFSPWTDMTGTSKSYATKANVDPVLSPEYIQRAVESYAPGEDVRNPYLSPRFADMSGFPPVYIQVGTNEILYGDSVALNKKLLEANVIVNFEAFKGMWHVFQMTPLKAASEAIDKAAEFVFAKT